MNTFILTNTAVTFMAAKFLKDSFTYCCEGLTQVTDEVRGG